MAREKTWREKLRDSKDLPKVVSLRESARMHWKGDTMAIPSPMEVNDIMRKVPRGKLITISEICKIVARMHGADIGCPLTCGIFAWIAAHAAAEEAREGNKDITPYWRTLRAGGELNPKYPGGIDEQRSLLESEGHKMIQKGRKRVVDKFEMKLVQASNLEESLSALHQARAVDAVASLRRRSAELGTENISMDEIDTEIQAVRRKRT